MRLLLIEDDPMIGGSIRYGLRQDGCTVDRIQDGEAAELALHTTSVRWCSWLSDYRKERPEGLDHAAVSG